MTPSKNNSTPTEATSMACPVCGKGDLKDLRALKAHVRMAHGKTTFDIVRRNLEEGHAPATGTTTTTRTKTRPTEPTSTEPTRTEISTPPTAEPTLSDTPSIADLAQAAKTAVETAPDPAQADLPPPPAPPASVGVLEKIEGLLARVEDRMIEHVLFGLSSVVMMGPPTTWAGGDRTLRAVVHRVRQLIANRSFVGESIEVANMVHRGGATNYRAVTTLVVQLACFIAITTTAHQIAGLSSRFIDEKGNGGKEPLVRGD